MIRIGAVAYAPYVVTIFEGIKRHFQSQQIDLDWVLYSNYDALVEAFVTREVDLAWNGPLAYVKIRQRLQEPCTGGPAGLLLSQARRCASRARPRAVYFS